MNIFNISFRGIDGEDHTEQFMTSAGDRDTAAIEFNNSLFYPVQILSVEWTNLKLFEALVECGEGNMVRYQSITTTDAFSALEAFKDYMTVEQAWPDKGGDEYHFVCRNGQRGVISEYVRN